MRRDDKRQQRKMKRDIKRAGNKKRRQSLKRDLEQNPEDAAHSEADVGHYRSDTLNGMDDDQTRRRKDENETESGDSE